MAAAGLTVDVLPPAAAYQFHGRHFVEAGHYGSFEGGGEGEGVVTVLV